MCSTSLHTKKPWYFHQALLYTAMVTLGLLSGYFNIPILRPAGFIISDCFIQLFRCVSLPIISLSLIVTLSSYRQEDNMKSLWRRTLYYTFGTTLLAASVSSLLYYLIHPQNIHHALLSSQTSNPLSTNSNYTSHLAHLIPENLFSPFIEHQVMGVLFISIVIGMATRSLPDESTRLSLSQFFKGMHSLFIIITGWIVKMIPLALFGFTTNTAAQLHEGLHFQGLGQYLAIVVFANLIQGFIILPAWLKINGLRPYDSMKKMLPALSMAFFSKSSAGTLPITIKTAEARLQIPSKLTRLILPICTSLNMNGCAAFIFATVVYVMQNHGITLSFSYSVLWIFIASLAAIGNAGVPMGCFFLSASLLSSMNVPITLMGIILPFYSLIDMLETALNVWSDSCVTQMVYVKSEDSASEAIYDKLLKEN